MPRDEKNDVSSQTPLEIPSSQYDRNTFGSCLQGTSVDGNRAEKTVIPADPPKSDFELVEPLIHRSKATIREMACYSGQTAALTQVRYAVELRRLLRVPSYVQDMENMNGILLHGPPGTGKTLVARVLASKAGITMFNASPSYIMSRYVGDGEK